MLWAHNDTCDPAFMKHGVCNMKHELAGASRDVARPAAGIGSRRGVWDASVFDGTWTDVWEGVILGSSGKHISQQLMHD